MDNGQYSDGLVRTPALPQACLSGGEAAVLECTVSHPEGGIIHAHDRLALSKVPRCRLVPKRR